MIYANKNITFSPLNEATVINAGAGIIAVHCAFNYAENCYYVLCRNSDSTTITIQNRLLTDNSLQLSNSFPGYVSSYGFICYAYGKLYITSNKSLLVVNKDTLLLEDTFVLTGSVSLQEYTNIRDIGNNKLWIGFQGNDPVEFNTVDNSFTSVHTYRNIATEDRIDDPLFPGTMWLLDAKNRRILFCKKDDPSTVYKIIQTTISSALYQLEIFQDYLVCLEASATQTVLINRYSRSVVRQNFSSGHSNFRRASYNVENKTLYYFQSVNSTTYRLIQSLIFINGGTVTRQTPMYIKSSASIPSWSDSFTDGIVIGDKIYFLSRLNCIVIITDKYLNNVEYVSWSLNRRGQGWTLHTDGYIYIQQGGLDNRLIRFNPQTYEFTPLATMGGFGDVFGYGDFIYILGSTDDVIAIYKYDLNTQAISVIESTVPFSNIGTAYTINGVRVGDVLFISQMDITTAISFDLTTETFNYTSLPFTVKNNRPVGVIFDLLVYTGTDGLYFYSTTDNEVKFTLSVNTSNLTFVKCFDDLIYIIRNSPVETITIYKLYNNSNLSLLYRGNLFSSSIITTSAKADNRLVAVTSSGFVRTAPFIHDSLHIIKN